MLWISVAECSLHLCISVADDGFVTTTMAEIPSRDGFNDFILYSQMAIYAICIAFKLLGFQFNALFAALIAVGAALFYRQVKSAYVNGSLKYITGAQDQLHWRKQVIFITGGVSVHNSDDGADSRS